MRVVWSPSALRDIRHIFRYIARFNRRAAEDLARELIVAGDSLEIFPQRGRLVPGTNLREWSLVTRTSSGIGLPGITSGSYVCATECVGAR